MLILIVEDSKQILITLVQILGYAGYKTMTAGDGVQALKRLTAGPIPDLILCDDAMPNMSGEGLINTLKASPQRTIALIPLASGRMLSRYNSKARMAIWNG